LDGCGPEIQLIASAMAVVTEEDVLSDVDRETGVGKIRSLVKRARTAPLVTADLERDVVQLFQDRTDRDLSAQDAVVESRHARDLMVTGGTGATRRVGLPPPRADRAGHDGPDRTCP